MIMGIYFEIKKCIFIWVIEDVNEWNGNLILTIYFIKGSKCRGEEIGC